MAFYHSDYVDQSQQQVWWYMHAHVHHTVSGSRLRRGPTACTDLDAALRHTAQAVARRKCSRCSIASNWRHSLTLSYVGRARLGRLHERHRFGLDTEVELAQGWQSFTVTKQDLDDAREGSDAPCPEA